MQEKKYSGRFPDDTKNDTKGIICNFNKINLLNQLNTVNDTFLIPFFVLNFKVMFFQILRKNHYSVGIILFDVKNSM
jgi:hypothetical protein